MDGGVRAGREDSSQIMFIYHVRLPESEEPESERGPGIWTVINTTNKIQVLKVQRKIWKH